MSKGKRKGNKETRRLAIVIADSGLASRRKAERLIQEGLVTVNGRVVRDLARKVYIDSDVVAVEGEPVGSRKKKSYYLLNKPAGYLSTCNDPRGRPTVLDLIPVSGKRLYPVGRLDFNAQGLLLVTDDGRVSYRMTHPRFQIPREYRVKVRGQPARRSLTILTRGIRWEGQFLRARRVEKIRETRNNAWFKVMMTEGRYHEVRKLFAAIGHPVTRLVRTAYGPLRIGRLALGQWRPLTDREKQHLVKYLFGEDEKN